jgi:hypothetical protein
MPVFLHSHQWGKITPITINVEMDIGNYPNFVTVNPLVKWGIA